MNESVQLDTADLRDGSFASPDDEMDNVLDDEEYIDVQDATEVVMLSDDFLSSITNATEVLLKGSDIERLAVLFQFPQLLEHCPEETFQIMVPEICRDVMRWNEEVQMAAAEALYFAVNTVVPSVASKRIVIASLRIIDMTESSDVFDAWGEILSSIIPQANRTDIMTLIAPATIDRANRSEIQSRRFAARVIGSLSESLEKEEIEQSFLKPAVSLCQDEDDSVRAMIAQSLASVGSKLPLKIIENGLWKHIRKLLQDNNARVRAAALRAIACSAEAHKNSFKSSKSYRTIILPTFMKECRSATEVAMLDLRDVDDDTYLMLEIFSEVFGYMFSSVYKLIKEEDDFRKILTCYKNMVTCNGPTVRHWCAYNFPAVAYMCSEKYVAGLSGVLKALRTDNDVETRGTLASGIHESARILVNGDLHQELLETIAFLLTDSSSLVRMKSLKHFSEILMLFSRDRKKMKPESSIKSEDHQFFTIFSSLRSVSFDNWRTQELLANQLEESAYLIPQSLLCEYVAPILFQMARESTYLVRKASMSALIATIRYIPDVRRRDHILKHLRSEWARGKVYWTRIAFIDGCKVALEILSRHLFTALFANELFLLSEDPVPNVRIRVARMMPEVAIACGSKESFSKTMKKLLLDSDVDVRKEANHSRYKILQAPPQTAQMREEDTNKRAVEKKFFVQKKGRKTSQEKTRRKPGSEISENLESTESHRENLSFSNSFEIMSGATKTVVVHSVLGSSSVTMPENNKGPSFVEGRILSERKQDASNDKTRRREGKKGSSSSSKSSRDRKSSSMRLHSVRRKKRAMCGCFGGT